MSDDFLSDEDKAAFNEHMRGVTPLPQGEKYQSTSPSKPLPSRRKQVLIPSSKTYFLSDTVYDPVPSEAILSFKRPQVLDKQFKSLIRGLQPWEAKLDLHGCKSDEARERLCNFIEQQVKQQHRYILVIHGIGGREGTPPVIKNLVNRWLPQFGEVLAFHSAQPKDGGKGAVYVLLQRTREY